MFAYSMRYGLILLCRGNSIVKVRPFTLSRCNGSTLVDSYYNTLIDTISQSVKCTNFNGCPCTYCTMFFSSKCKSILPNNRHFNSNAVEIWLVELHRPVMHTVSNCPGDRWWNSYVHIMDLSNIPI